MRFELEEKQIDPCSQEETVQAIAFVPSIFAFAAEQLGKGMHTGGSPALSLDYRLEEIFRELAEDGADLLEGLMLGIVMDDNAAGLVIVSYVTDSFDFLEMAAHMVHVLPISLMFVDLETGTSMGVVHQTRIRRRLDRAAHEIHGTCKQYASEKENLGDFDFFGFHHQLEHLGGELTGETGYGVEHLGMSAVLDDHGAGTIVEVHSVDSGKPAQLLMDPAAVPGAGMGFVKAQASAARHVMLYLDRPGGLLPK